MLPSPLFNGTISRGAGIGISDVAKSEGSKHDEGAARGGERWAQNPTDRAKDGVKRSLLTDAAGISIGLTVDGANRNDFKLTRETIKSIPVDRPRPTRATPVQMTYFLRLRRA